MLLGPPRKARRLPQRKNEHAARELDTLIKRQLDHETSLLWLLPTRSFCRAALPSLCPFGSGNGPTICPEATIGNPMGGSS